MKNLFIVFIILLCFAACNSGSTSSGSTSGKDSLTSAVTLPYTAKYSSNFVPGKQTDVLAVLNNYKAWADNDVAAMKATFGDSIEMIFSNGMEFNGPVDSLIKMIKPYRDSLSKVDFIFYAWTPNHSVDQNEDWVNVWYKEIDTYKTGKVDSAFYQDDNRLKDGKIVWMSSHIQKYKK